MSRGEAPVRFEAGRLRHAGRVARIMRAADVAECAAYGRSPHQALHHSIRASSMVLTAFVGDTPHAIFGLVEVSVANGLGRPWFLGSEEVYRRPREMITHGSFVVDLMLDRLPRLENMVSENNHRALRMLRAWDFQIEGEPVYVGESRFLRFAKERQCAIPAPS